MPICEAFAQIEQQLNVYDAVHVKYYDEVWLDLIISKCCLIISACMQFS